jgi:CBS-domain-containing membrane protein
VNRTVQDVMTRGVVSAGMAAPFKDLVHLLREHRVAPPSVVDVVDHLTVRTHRRRTSGARR